VVPIQRHRQRDARPLSDIETAIEIVDWMPAKAKLRALRLSPIRRAADGGFTTIPTRLQLSRAIWPELADQGEFREQVRESLSPYYRPDGAPIRTLDARSKAPLTPASRVYI
jgi:hypothetical protein